MGISRYNSGIESFMAENLTAALLIMAIGMGVVFASILLLWGVMAALVRLTADHAPAAPPVEPEDTPADLESLRQQAAAAAVAVARQRAAGTIGAQALPPTASVSPWQAVMRGRQLRQRGPVR
jgi:Na+-transporting methylmalonyl-CoA/oxaloacetate decarboxylase gamma subunit